MRTIPPVGFDVTAFYADVYLFQTWDIFPGHRASGQKSVDQCLANLGLPDRLDGLRVLEIAPWNGFFGFECLRRGARELVVLGPDDPDNTGFKRTAELLEIEHQIRYVQASVYDIMKYELGKFDVVLFLGLVYHLRHPLLAIDLLHDHCTEGATFLIDGPIMNRVEYVADERDQEGLRSVWDSVQHIPMTMFVRGGAAVPLSHDDFNWFVPNAACMAAWVRSSGFEILHETVTDSAWHFIRARSIKRPFATGLEGFNPHAQQKVTNVA